MKKRYQVIVGNIGEVCDHNDEEMAHLTYEEYVSQSKMESGKASGEAVTLIEDSHPIKEHLGWRYLFENYSEDEVRHILSTRRCDDRLDICPNCEGTPMRFSTHLQTEEYDGGKDFRYKKLMKCTSCGLFWYDILAVVGIELVSEVPKNG
jgi:YgiT-type zinc finger domain-containing protein